VIVVLPTLERCTRDDDAGDVKACFTLGQNSIPACARTFFVLQRMFDSVISVTRSARSMISSGALRPVRTT